MRRLCSSVLVFAFGLLWTVAAGAQQTALPAAVTALLRKAQVPLGSVSVVIQQVDQSQPLLRHNADAVMNPASSMKLVSSYAALNMLGLDYTWKTRIYSQQRPDSNGVLHGDLYIKGGGDPKLTVEQLWLLLRDLRLRGVREIRGGLVLDRSWFAPVNGDTGSFDSEPIKPQNTLPDALLLNFNSVRFDFLLTPRAETARLDIVGDFPALKIHNAVRVVNGACGDWRDRLTVDYQPAASIPEIRFSGLYAESCGDKRWHFSLHHQHSDYFAALFAQLWQQLGGSWQTTAGAVRVREVREAVVPEQAILLLEHESAPLSEIIRDMNKFSNNVMARQLFLTLSAEAQAVPATPQDSARLIAEWLKNIGLNMPELVLENGSGLSRIERINASHLAALLLHAWHSPAMPEFISSLSLFGVDGTTKRRYKNHAVAGQAHLKTGSLNDVRSLAGYVRSISGKRYVLVWIVNDARASDAIPAQEALLEWLYLQ
jgi:D-alanyl-D-alanine carboxypeptidase/D-alanyl-D-alanine-endopeptidase (penicillin-binding protein 4)